MLSWLKNEPQLHVQKDYYAALQAYAVVIKSE